MCGCTPTMDLGCFDSCKPIDTKLQATVTGIWTARVCFNGVWLTQEVEAIMGESIILVNDYPEEILLTLQLIQPNGIVLPGGPFSFKNKITIAV